MTTIEIKDVETPKLSTENPLVIERILRRKDGGSEIILSLSKEQQYMLLEFAIMALTAHGFIHLQEPQEQAPEAAEEVAVEKGEQVH